MHCLHWLVANITTNTSVLELIVAFASASKCTMPRRSNFWFLLEPTHVGGGPAETGQKAPPRQGPAARSLVLRGSMGQMVAEDMLLAGY